MCVLKVYSKNKSFKEYATHSTMPVYSVREVGEIRRKSTGETWEEYSISFNVSDREWDDFPGQVRDAIQFLSENKEVLHELISTHPIADAYLDFPIWSRLSEEIINQNDHLPKELISLCGKLEIGIEMAIYGRDAFDTLENRDETESGTGSNGDSASAPSL